MSLTSELVSKKYNCDLSKNSGFDDNRKFWVAFENEIKDEELKFEYAEGWTLQELVEDIKSKIKKRAKLLAGAEN
jgi:hypothetical protein